MRRNKKERERIAVDGVALVGARFSWDDEIERKRWNGKEKGKRKVTNERKGKRTILCFIFIPICFSSFFPPPLPSFFHFYIKIG